MEFKKYTSIENSYRQKVVDKISTYFPKEEFVVQEKIHGSNFAFYVDENDIRMAKRSSFLGEGDTFYNCQILLERYKTALEGLRHILGTSFSIHGETFGGTYPHKDVPKVQGVVKVQNKCFYSPDAEFAAFDMKVDGEYISIDRMNELLDQVGIPRLKVLARGTLEECLQYPNEFKPQMPIERGYPDIKENVCEGTVIKSNRPVRLPNGERAILKNKNSKFTEKSNKKTKTPTKVPEHLKPYIGLMTSLINENRLRNVLSKIGPIEDQKTAFHTVMKPFSADVMEDFLKEAEGFQELEKDERKVVSGLLGKQSAILIRQNLGAILDGDL